MSEFDKYKAERLSEYIDPQVLVAVEAAFAAGQAAEREACEEVAINKQGSVSQFPTLKACVAFNEGCREVAAAIRQRGEK